MTDTIAQKRLETCAICGAEVPKSRWRYCSARCCEIAAVRRRRNVPVQNVKTSKSSTEPAKCPLDCRYLMAFPYNDAWPHHCGYILITGHSRGCDPGEGCIRYQKKRRKGKSDGERAT